MRSIRSRSTRSLTVGVAAAALAVTAGLSGCNDGSDDDDSGSEDGGSEVEDNSGDGDDDDGGSDGGSDGDDDDGDALPDADW